MRILIPQLLNPGLLDRRIIRDHSAELGPWSVPYTHAKSGQNKKRLAGNLPSNNADRLWVESPEGEQRFLQALIKYPLPSI